MREDIDKRYANGYIVAASCEIRKVKPPPATTDAIMWKVESQTNPEVFYSVVMFKDGQVICTCKDFMNRRDTCKHIIGVCLYETT